MPIFPRNGIITGYRVTYVAVLNPADNGVVEFHGAALQSGNVTDLHYWTHYNFSIAAGTRIGFGVDSGPITIRTDEHGKRRSAPVSTTKYGESALNFLLSIKVPLLFLPNYFRQGNRLFACIMQNTRSIKTLVCR